jgi:hypothetical protein
MRHATDAAAPPPPPYPQGTSSEQIRRDIRHTRGEMDETVDALEHRLRPRHLIDDLLESFRSSGGGGGSGATESFKNAGHQVLDKLKQHPMPAALIGAGIVWLMLDDDGRARRDDYRPRKWDVPAYSGSYVDARTGRPYDIEGYGEGFGRHEGAQGSQEGGPSMTEQAADKLSGAAESVKGAAQSAAEKAGEWTGAARNAASSAARATRGYASTTSDQLSRGYETGKHYVARGMDEYPLAMGAAAMALGVLGGLCLPRSRVEDRYLGDTADEVKARAGELGRDAVEAGRELGRQVAGTAKDEAARQGLEPGSIAEKVKRVAGDVKETLADSAKREGIDPQTLKHKGQQVAERTKETAKETAKDGARRTKERFDA